VPKTPYDMDWKPICLESGSSPPYSSVVDKLVVVSKIFADQRVIELLAENRKLKLQLFWKDYGIKNLEKSMQRANTKTGGPHCKCLACAVSGRLDEDEDGEAAGFECCFKPYFDALLLECEIETKNGGGGEGRQHMSNSSGNCVYDEECHIVRLGRDDWAFFTYGSKLWNATRVDDPELLKLSNLFAKLEEEDNEIED
jgi:hypothetical protein